MQLDAPAATESVLKSVFLKNMPGNMSSFEGEAPEVDTRHFILEVKSRPAIWDNNDDDYSNRDLRKKYWDELVSIFLRSSSPNTIDREEFVRILQRKWKSLRDCYSRERQRLAKMRNGACVSRKNQYIFYNELSFLHPVVKSKIVYNTDEANVDGKSFDASTSSPHETPEQKGMKRQKKTDKSLSREELQHLKDGDRLFLLSLLDPLKKIPEDMRFCVRMELMRVVYNALNLHSSQAESQDLSSSHQGAHHVSQFNYEPELKTFFHE